jgi:hypothetical protein
MRLFLITLLLTGAILSGYAQEQTDKKYKDFFQIKAPVIQYSEPDTEEILFEDELKSDQGEAIYFNPELELSIYEEDYDSAIVLEEDFSIVEIAEEMKMDCVWVTIAEYFAIWDSRTINPYKIDPTKYKDTISFNLYDSLNNFMWSMPLKNCPVNSAFGMRSYRWHYGTDLDLSIGDPVLAAFDGIVRINKYDGSGYGNYILLRHYNGLETLYAHLSSANVKVGQLVKAGEVIGLGGNTGRSSGPHLHYEVRYEGNAIDPHKIYDFKNNTLASQTFHLTPSHFDYIRTARQVVYHRIKSGETLGAISRKYNVSINTLCSLNKISTRSILRVGQRLRIR